MPRIRQKNDPFLKIYDKGRDNMCTMVRLDDDTWIVEKKARTIKELTDLKKSIKLKHNIPYFSPVPVYKDIPWECHESGYIHIDEYNNTDESDNIGGVYTDVNYGDVKNDDNCPNNDKKHIFTINERFDMAKDIVDLVIDGKCLSVVLCGKGGLGKSYTVYDALSKKGYDLTHVDNLRGMSFVQVKGNVTKLHLYKLLYDARDRLIVFDDCDAVFKSEDTQNILKSALDTTGVRRITYLSNSLDQGSSNYPMSFIFNGKIIFISNRKISEIPESIRSRSFILDLDFTPDELIERMYALVDKMLPELTQDQAKELIEYLDINKSFIKNFSLRTLLKAGTFVKAGLSNWKELTLYAN